MNIGSGRMSVPETPGAVSTRDIFLSREARVWYVPKPYIEYRDADGHPITYHLFLELVQTPNYSTLIRTELPDGVLRTDWIGFDAARPSTPVNVIETVFCTFGSKPEVRVLGKDACADDAAIRHDYWMSVLAGP